jgi:hypothetical protein
MRRTWAPCKQPSAPRLSLNKTPPTHWSESRAFRVPDRPDRGRAEVLADRPLEYPEFLLEAFGVRGSRHKVRSRFACARLVGGRVGRRRRRPIATLRLVNAPVRHRSSLATRDELAIERRNLHSATRNAVYALAWKPSVRHEGKPLALLARPSRRDGSSPPSDNERRRLTPRREPRSCAYSSKTAVPSGTVRRYA